MYVEFKKNFLLTDSSALMVFYTDFSLLSQKTFDSHFLDMMYVEFKKNFLLADWSELRAVRFISISLAQKRLIPTI